MQEEILRIARDLIKIKSITGNEGEIIEYISKFFEKRNIEFEIFEREKGRGNIVSEGDKVVLNGHVDVVPIADESLWNTPPFSPILKNGILYGRGAFDMKASLAVIIALIAKFKKRGVEGISAHIVSDEERGGEYGTKYLIELMKRGKIPRPKYCIVGEQSFLRIRNAERGLFQFEIKFFGKSAHTASARTLGDNAILKAAKAVLALEKPIEKFHPEIGYPVISINKIYGGTVNNQVPAKCSILVDRRTIIGETKESVLEEVRETLDLLKLSYEISIPRDMEGKEIYHPPNITPRENPLIKTIAKNIKEVLGKVSYFTEWGGCTDGRFYRYQEIPTVVFGPLGGSGHGPNEWVDVSSLEKQALVLYKTCRELVT